MPTLISAKQVAEELADVPPHVAQQVARNMSSMVQKFKRSRAFDVSRYTIFTISWAVDPRVLLHHSVYMLSLEGILQSAATWYFTRGVPVKFHGAPVPLKMFYHPETGYRSFASTFPLLMRDGKLWAPYKGGYVPAEIRDDGTIVADDAVKPLPFLRHFTAVATVFRGERFITYYDFLRLGKKPPSTIVKGAYDMAAGPAKNLLSYVPVLKYPLVYIAAGFSDVVSQLLNEMFVGYGWKGMGSIVDIHVEQHFMLDSGRLRTPYPEEFLFADTKSGRGYVLLRPMPVRIWRRDDVVWGAGVAETLQRNVPPYHYTSSDPGNRDVRVELHYLPGVIVRRVPELEYVVG